MVKKVIFFAAGLLLIAMALALASGPDSHWGDAASYTAEAFHWGPGDVCGP